MLGPVYDSGRNDVLTPSMESREEREERGTGPKLQQDARLGHKKGWVRECTDSSLFDANRAA